MAVVVVLILQFTVPSWYLGKTLVCLLGWLHITTRRVAVIKKIVLGIVGLFVVILIIGALGSGGSDAPQQQAAAVAPVSATNIPTKAAQAKPTPTAVVLPAVGTPIAEGNWVYRVNEVERAETVTWSQYGNKTDAKGEWIIAFLTIKNIGKETYALNAWDFEIHDSASIKYKADSMTSSMYAEYKGASGLGDDFPPGVQAETYILFDVNPDAKGLRLWVSQAKKYIALE